MAVNYYTSRLKRYASDMRKDMTPQESQLWYGFLHTLPVRFRRQKVFDPYIVDFYCAQYQLVIEIDGSQHFEEAAMRYDALRTAYLEGLGLKVIRFTNLQIDHEFRAVCETIANEIGLNE